jgi:hypothetical protein
LSVSHKFLHQNPVFTSPISPIRATSLAHLILDLITRTEASKMRSFYICSAARDVISEKNNPKNIWILTTNNFIRIHMNILFSYMLYNWQHNTTHFSHKQKLHLT